MNGVDTVQRRLLKVAVFLDGTPGHEKQTMGVVNSLERMHPLEIEKISITKQPIIKDILSWLGYLFHLGSFTPTPGNHYDLLIGTGSHTHIPILACKRFSGGLACTCMAPAWPLRRQFDLCFVPQHDGITGDENIFVTIGPPNCARGGSENDPKKGLILLGGIDPKSHHWNSSDIAGYMQEILIRETEMEWTISSSPRTPMETVSLVEKMAQQFYNVTFFKFEETKAGWVEEQYRTNKMVWVTADSMSMVYEALTAGCSVGILPVVWKNRANKFKRSEEYLLQHDLAVSFAAWRDGNRGRDMREPLDEAGRCAREIMKRWFQKS